MATALMSEALWSHVLVVLCKHLQRSWQLRLCQKRCGAMYFISMTDITDGFAQASYVPIEELVTLIKNTNAAFC